MGGPKGPEDYWLGERRALREEGSSDSKVSDGVSSWCSG